MANGTDNYSECEMRAIYSTRPDEVRSASWSQEIGQYGGVHRLLVRFDDISAKVSAGTDVTRAVLRLYQTANTRANGHILDLFALGRAFDAASVTWNSPWSQSGAYPGDVDGAAITSITLDSQNGVWREFDVTNYVREVVSGQRANNGFLLKARDETDGESRYFFAEDTSNNALHPELVIEYGSGLAAPGNFRIVTSP